MSRLQLYSEPFAKTGNMAAEGFRRLLGRPTLGLLHTMIRESIQNVLDAAHGDAGPTVRIRLRTLSAAQQRALTEELLGERPRGDVTFADIDAALAKPNLRVMEVCDFGTEGLTGPTRADAPHDGKEPLNFINFLRNVGAARDIHHGGGTYGYGKSSLYSMSSCSTIVVDSEARVSRRYERRLMACHLGAAFDAAHKKGDRRRFTGRHWWGVLDGPDSIEPVTGEHAKALSMQLGMPARKNGQTGTSILIVDPVVADDDASSTIEDVIEIVLWNFWPRMTASTPEKRKLRVEVWFESQQMSVPTPEEFPPLDLFAAAMATHRAKARDVRPIWCRRPKKQLGNLVISQGLRADRRGSAARDGSIIPIQASHIALMRPVELVVKYIEGEPRPDRRFEWAGVFVCSDDDEVEGAFALAEPPAHDDWVSENLPKGNAKTFVRVALRELQDIARPQASPAGASPATSDRGPSLAATAARMGTLLGSVSASGPGLPARKKVPSSARRSLSTSTPRFVGLQLGADGRPLARFCAELENDESDDNLYLSAEPYLVIDGGSTSVDDLPDIFKLNVAQIRFGTVLMSGPLIHVGSESGTVEVLVPTISEVAIGLRLRLHSGKPR